MAGRQKARVSWPGAYSVESFSYTASHGPSPGVAQLAVVPKAATDAPPAMSGDLMWGDGSRTVRLRDCQVDAIDPVKDSRGLTWTLRIFDRRWRWVTPKGAKGAVSGKYNQPDPRGKFVPWTVRSPAELAELCFEELGETNYEITGLPAGLSRLDGAKFDEFLMRGENFKMSLANPPVRWDYTPPALALASLVETFGCRLIYQPVRDRFLVAKLGVGADLPDLPAESVGRSVDPPEAPKALVVVGAPTRFQCRLVLEPVGEEWDGKVTPVDDLSYKPEGRGTTGAKQVTSFTYQGSSVLTGDIVVTFTVPDPIEPGLYVEYAVSTTAPGDTIVDNMTAVAALINAHPGLAGLTAAVTTNAEGRPVLVLTGTTAGVGWGGAAIAPADPDNTAATWAGVSTLPESPELVGGWEYCGPPNFTAAKPTDRLAYDQARAKARGSVYSWYRVALVDPATNKPGLTIPGYGKITRRQQIILLPNKCAQLVPEPRNAKAQDNRGRGGRLGALPDYYDGYSRDQNADVYGAVSKLIGTVLWGPGLALNTDPGDKVYVPFQVVPEKQMIAFAAPVWRRGVSGTNVVNGQSLPFVRFEFPRLVLETAVLIMDPDTSALVREQFRETPAGKGTTAKTTTGKGKGTETGIDPGAGKGKSGKLPGAGVEFEVHDDVQLDVIPTYGDRHQLLSVERDTSDARPRADYYLAAMRAKYELTQADTRRYPGILAIDPDGRIQQVSWSIGGGATTTASANTEHSVRVPPYPARRRAENLPPDVSAAVANLIEQARSPYRTGIAVLTTLGLGLSSVNRGGGG